MVENPYSTYDTPRPHLSGEKYCHIWVTLGLESDIMYVAYCMYCVLCNALNSKKKNNSSVDMGNVIINIMNKSCFS